MWPLLGQFFTLGCFYTFLIKPVSMAQTSILVKFLKSVTYSTAWMLLEVRGFHYIFDGHLVRMKKRLWPTEQVLSPISD